MLTITFKIRPTHHENLFFVKDLLNNKLGDQNTDPVEKEAARNSTRRSRNKERK